MKKNILCVLLAAVLALIPFAGIAGEEPVVMLASINMYPGDVLHCNSTMVGFPLENPTGYAELSADGKTLTLNNFDNNGFWGKEAGKPDNAALIVYGPLTLNLQGHNKLSNASGSGEGIRLRNDLTIKGTGSLKIDADWGIYNCEHANLAITSGDLTIKGKGTNIIADHITITGGKLDLTSEYKAGLLSNYDLTISGGEVNIKAPRAIADTENVTISGGEVNITSGEYAVNADNELRLTGGKMTVTSQYKTLIADKIICTLPIPEGVEIRSIDNREWMDYTTHLDQMAASGIIRPQWRTFQLIGQTADPVDPAAPALPATGDNANIALWAALALASICAMMAMRRRQLAK